jgi:ubiquinone/menaquinone biosynthesis C-methylase UbiE
VMCSFMIFHMSEMMRQKGILEIYRVLKPQGRLLILDTALPPQPLFRAIIQKLFGYMEHDLHELIPLMEASGFSNLETGYAKFRILGISFLSFILGSTLKS